MLVCVMTNSRAGRRQDSAAAPGRAAPHPGRRRGALLRGPHRGRLLRGAARQRAAGDVQHVPAARAGSPRVQSGHVSRQTCGGRRGTIGWLAVQGWCVPWHVAECSVYFNVKSTCRSQDVQH